MPVHGPRPPDRPARPAASWIPLGALAAALLGCGEPEPASRAALPDVAAAPPVISGAYDVSGTTVEIATGARRDVAGTVIVLVGDGGETYEASFNLRTTLVESGAPQRAELVGTGSGRIDGAVLEGSAQTQLIVALVPGVDAGFGLMPRAATARIANRSHAVVAADGSVEIRIESEAVPDERGGADYRPTRTTLHGRRVDVLGRPLE